MARFYRTASANPLDYMFRMNTPLMEKVLSTNEGYITQNLAQAQKLDDAATSFAHLTPDAERAKQIGGEYDKKIQELTDAIRKDPVNWRKQAPNITNLSRELQSNMKTGEISKIVGNYTKYKEVSDYIDKQVEQYNKGKGGGMDAGRAKAYKEYFLNEFVKKNPKGTGYDPNTGDYNALSAFNPMANMDIKKTLSESLDKIKADKSFRYEERPDGTGWYFNKETEKMEQITPDKVLRIAASNLSPQLMDYMKQESQVGLMSGVFDKDGGFIKPYDYTDVPITSEEQSSIDKIQADIKKIKDKDKRDAEQQKFDANVAEMKQRKRLEFNSESSLAPIFQGLAETFSYSNIERGNTMKSDSRGGILANISSREKINSINEAGRNARWQGDNQFKYDKLAQDKAIAEAKIAADKEKAALKPGAKKPAATAVTAAEKASTLILDNAILNPFYTTGQNGIKTASDQTALLTTLRAKEGQLESAIQNETDETKLNSLRLQLQETKDNLYQVRDYYGKAVEAGKSLALKSGKVTEADIREYDRLLATNDPEGTTQKEAMIALTNMLKTTKKDKYYYEKGPMGKSQYDNDRERANNFALGNFNRVKKAIDAGRNKYISGLNQNTAKETELVTTTTTQNKTIFDGININPSQFKIFDPKTGQEMGSDKGQTYYVSSSGKNTPLTFEGDNKSILTYMKNSGKTFEELFDVEGTTLPLNFNGDNTTGAGVRIKFKDGVGNVGGKSFFMTIPKVLQDKLAEEYKTSKDEKVKTFGDKLADNTRNHFINSLNRVDQQSDELTAQGINSIPAGQVTIETKSGIHTFRSVPVKVGGKTVYQAEKLINGKFEKFGTEQRRSGLFESNADLWEQVQPIIK